MVTQMSSGVVTPKGRQTQGRALWFRVRLGSQTALSLIPAPLLPSKSVALGLSFLSCKVGIKVAPPTWGCCVT